VPTNQIRSVTFRPVPPDPDGESEGGHALFLAIDVADPARLLGFLEEVVSRFKAERMSGPPDTRFMLITLVGEVAAADFAQVWRTAIANDLPARALLGTLHHADVVQGDERGRVIGQASLLAAEPEAPVAER
jgi:streptomycin 6-kinase